MSQAEIFGRITKPNLVNFLRICDKERLTVQRIRYASIRSKGALIKDIMRYFYAVQNDAILTIRSKEHNPRFVELEYCTERRSFLRQGQPFDCEIVSRKKPQYQIEHKRVTLNFGSLYSAKGGPGTGTISGVASWFA